MVKSSAGQPAHLRATEIHRRRLHHAQRRFVLLAAALVGVLSGGFAVLFQFLLMLAETQSHAFAASLNSGVGGWILLVLGGSAFGALAGFITEKYCPEAGGSGIPHVKAVLMNLRSLRPMVLIPVKMVGGLLALSSGMSLGREGPTIQIGAAVGQLVAKLGKAPRRSYPTLIAAGAGAGLAAAFNAPLAGFIFVMEELKREMSPLTYGAALIASVCSVAVARVELGQGASFVLANPAPVPLRALPIVALLGLVTGLLGIVFNRLTLGSIGIRERLKLPRWVAGALIGAVAVLCMRILPEITGPGHSLAESILSGHMDLRLSLGLVAVMLVGKLLLTSTSFATGVPGGIFAPLLVMGALTGYGVGSAMAQAFPGLGISPHVFATIGMASFLASSVRAPLTGVVLIVEMTQQYSILYALLLGSFVSYIVADLMRDTPIYEALLERELHRTGELGVRQDSTVPLDLIVEPDSYMDGRHIRDLRLPPGALIVTIERDGGVIVPHGATKVRFGDHVSVLLAGDDSDAATIALHDAARAP